MKNIRWLIAITLLLLLPALACTTLSGGDDAATDEPATEEPVAPTEEPPTELPPPTATVDSTANFISYDNTDVGLAFQYPADWFVDDIFFVTVASNERLLTEGTDGIDEGAILMIIPDSTDGFGGSDPVTLLNESAMEFAVGDDQTVTSEPAATIIQGQPAAVATIAGTGDDGVEFEGLFAVIVNGDWAALVLGATPSADLASDEYMANLDAILRTIIVSEPEGGEFSPPGIDPPPVVSELVLIEIGDSREDAIPEGSAFDYSITLAAGDPVTIVAEPEDDLDLVLEIFKGDDLSQSLREVDDGFSGEKEEVVFAAPQDGEYIIRVRGFAGGGGSYAFSVTAGGTISQTEGLIPMILQTEYSGQLTGEPVGYLLTLTAAQSIPLILAPDNDELDLVLEIYDIFGNELEYIDNGFSGEPEALIFTSDSDGDYEVWVTAFGLDEGEYMLMALDPDLAFTDESEAGSDTPSSYRVCVPDGASLYAAALPEEEFDLTLTLFGAGGGNLTDEIDDGFSGESEVIYYVEGASSTEPYPIIVTVSGWASDSGRYTIWISSTSDTPVLLDGC